MKGLRKVGGAGKGKRKDVPRFLNSADPSRSLEQERKRRRSDFSASDSVALMTPLTAPLTTPTPTQTLSLVKTSSLNSTS